MGRGIRDLRTGPSPYSYDIEVRPQKQPYETLIEQIKAGDGGTEDIERLATLVEADNRGIRLEATLIVGIPRTLANLKPYQGDVGDHGVFFGDVGRLNWLLDMGHMYWDWRPDRNDIDALVRFRDDVLLPIEPSPLLDLFQHSVSHLIGRIDALEQTLKVGTLPDQRDAS